MSDVLLVAPQTAMVSLQLLRVFLRLSLVAVFLVVFQIGLVLVDVLLILVDVVPIVSDLTTILLDVGLRYRERGQRQGERSREYPHYLASHIPLRMPELGPGLSLGGAVRHGQLDRREVAQVTSDDNRPLRAPPSVPSRPLIRQLSSCRDPVDFFTREVGRSFAPFGRKELIAANSAMSMLDVIRTPNVESNFRYRIGVGGYFMDAILRR